MYQITKKSEKNDEASIYTFWTHVYMDAYLALILVGNGVGNSSSNPWQVSLHFTSC